MQHPSPIGRIAHLGRLVRWSGRRLRPIRFLTATSLPDGHAGERQFTLGRVTPQTHPPGTLAEGMRQQILRQTSCVLRSR